VCAYHCAQLSFTIQRRTVLIFFPIILRTIIITFAQMLSILERRETRSLHPRPQTPRRESYQRKIANRTELTEQKSTWTAWITDYWDC